MSSALFQNDDTGREAFGMIAGRAVQWIIHYYEQIESLPVRSQVQPGDVYNKFPDAPSESAVPVDEVFAQLDEAILPGITHWQHPGFYAFFPGNTSFPSITAEILTAGIAAQCMLWESSPAAAELEQRCVEWCRDLLGLPHHCKGAIQDTASTATLTALLTAREWKTGFEISSKGFDGRTYRIYASAQAHSSVEKAVRLAGFGTDNLVYIATDENLSMIPSMLEKAIQDDLAIGFIPVCVVSTIGTTATGAIDATESINVIAKTFDIWHHVDAAYAGTVMMLEEFAHLRTGMDGVDSFVFNPHKWMFVQFDCSIYLVKDADLLTRTMRITPSYLATVYGERVNDYRDWGIPLGRRFRALKLWMTFQLLGISAIKERQRHHLALAKNIEDKIKQDNRLSQAYDRRFNIVTFRVKEELDANGQLTKKLSEMINESGKAYMTHAVVEGKGLIRWVPAQTYVELRHIDEAWWLIQNCLEKLIRL